MIEGEIFSIERQSRPLSHRRIFLEEEEEASDFFFSVWPLRSQYPFLISPREHHLHFFFCLWVGKVGCVCITHTTGPRVGKLPPSLLETKCLRARRNPRQTSGGDAGEAAGGQTEEASVGISRPGTSKRVARSMGPVGLVAAWCKGGNWGNDNEWSDLDQLSPPCPDMSETRGRGRHHRGGVSCWGLTLARHSLQYGSV